MFNNCRTFFVVMYMLLKMLNINGFHGVPHSPWKVPKSLTIVRNSCSPLPRFTHPSDCCTIKSLCTFQQPPHKKWSFPLRKFPADLVPFTGEILNGKLYFLCSEPSYIGAQERLFFDTKQLSNKERHLDCNINSIFLKKKYYENIIQGSSFFFPQILLLLYHDSFWKRVQPTTKVSKCYLQTICKCYLYTIYHDIYKHYWNSSPEVKWLDS